MKKPKKPSPIWGAMTVLTEAGLDEICAQLEKRYAAGENRFDIEDHRRLRAEVVMGLEHRGKAPLETR